mgnify:CR=1 FL=1
MRDRYRRQQDLHSIKKTKKRAVDYLSGGSELVYSLGEQLVVGESFAFLTTGWQSNPTIASILQLAAPEHITSPTRPSLSAVDDAPELDEHDAFAAEMGIEVDYEELSLVAQEALEDEFNTTGGGGSHRATGLDGQEKIFPLWGKDEILLPGVCVEQRSVPSVASGSIWTDRRTYRANQDTVRIVVFDPTKAKKAAHLIAWREGEKLDEQAIALDTDGIGLLELDSLPPGRYRLVLAGGGSATEFVVALPRIQTLSARWSQHYFQKVGLKRHVFVFIVQLESLGAPLRGEVGINLIDFGVYPPVPVGGDLFRTDGAGRVAGEIPIGGEGIGPFSLEVQSLSDQEKNGLFPVPMGAAGEDEEEEQPLLTVNPLGKGLGLKWGGVEQNGTLGFRTEPIEAQKDTPILVEGIEGNIIRLTSQTQFVELMVSVLDPIRGTCEHHHWSTVERQQTLEIAFPIPLGVLVIGGFFGGRPWEGWTLAFAENAPRLHLGVPKRVKPGAQVQIDISLERTEPTPVYLVVKEESDDESTWGPSTTLYSVLEQLLPQLHVGSEVTALAKVAQDSKRQEPRKKGGPPSSAKPQLPHPSAPEGAVEGALPPGAPPPGGPPPGAPPGMNPSQLRKKTEAERKKELMATLLAEWQLPLPCEEDFPETLFSTMIHVQGQESISIDVKNEQNSFQVEAVALSKDGWSYAATRMEVGAETWAEILVPDMVHPDDGVVGEIICSTERPGIWLELYKDGYSVPLKHGEEMVEAAVQLHEPLNQLHFTLLPGHYVLRIRSDHGETIDEIEAIVAPWSVRFEDRFRIQLLQSGDTITAQPDKGLEPLPGLFPVLDQLCWRLLDFGARGQCISAAITVRAASCLCAWSNNPEDEQRMLWVIEQALADLERLLIPGRGFALNAEGDHDRELGIETVELLWDAMLLRGPNRPEELMELLAMAGHLADNAAQGYGLSMLPARIYNCRSGFRVFFMEESKTRKQEVMLEIDKRLVEKDGNFWIWEDGSVRSRQESCYASIVLLSSEEGEDRQKGLILLNRLLGELRTGGLLFSFQDSCGLLSLLEASLAICSQPADAKVEINEDTITWEEALSIPVFSEMTVHEGLVPVASRYRLERDLRDFSERIQWKLALIRRGETEFVKEADVGEKLELVLMFPPGAIQEGDMAEVFLPPCLAWLKGTKEEKSFSIPLQAQQEKLILPLAAISGTTDLHGEISAQHWGVRLINRYREERGNASFERALIVWPFGKRRKRGEKSWIGRWRKIFG